MKTTSKQTVNQINQIRSESNTSLTYYKLSENLQSTKQQLQQVSSFSSSQQFQPIIIKNLDSGDQLLPVNCTQIDSVSEIKQFLKLNGLQSQGQSLIKQINQNRISLWNKYWQQHTKIDQKLLKLVLNSDSDRLSKLLKEQPVEINSYIYMDGWTLLHHAAGSSNEKIVQILIQSKIEINQLTKQMKRTALHEAVLANKPKIVQVLITNDADPNIQDIDGNTPAHYAAEVSNQQIFQILLSSSIKLILNLFNNRQMSVIDCIRDQKIYKICQKYSYNLKQNIVNSINDINNQNQNQLMISQFRSVKQFKNRRIIKNFDGIILKRHSKSDYIQKFLTLRSIPNTNVQRLRSEDLTANYHHIQKQQQNIQLTSTTNKQNSQTCKKNSHKQSLESFKSTQSIQSLNNNKKQHRVGKKPSQWIQNKRKTIVSQSLFMMKQSLIDEYENQKNQGQNIQCLQNYYFLRYLGSGGFADVFLARRKKSKKIFAIKRINKSKILYNNLKRYVYAERNIMIKCSHPFIVQAFSMFQDQMHLYISMEYCQCGDLQKLIYSKQKLSQQHVKLYAAQIGLALQNIHSQNILFRDLKSANVLIQKDGYLKISDFGLAKQSLLSFSFLGSVNYLAPQMLVEGQLKQHTKSIDWYLYGTLIYELLTGKTPFYGQKQHILFKKIKQVKPLIPNYLSKECRSLLSKLLQKQPSMRLGSKNDFQQIIKQPWFDGIDFKKILNKQYQMPKVDPLISDQDLRKKIPIDQFGQTQKYEYFKEWNYLKS